MIKYVVIASYDMIMVNLVSSFSDNG